MAFSNQATLQQVLNSDPQLQGLLAQARSLGAANGFAIQGAHPSPQYAQLQGQIVSRAHQLVGTQLPSGYGVNPAGQITDSPGMISPALVAGLVGGSALGVGLLAGGGVAGAGASTTGDLASTMLGTGAVPAVGGAASGLVPAATGAAAASTVPVSTALGAATAGGISPTALLLGTSLAGSGLGAAANIYGSKQQGNANQQATAAQQQEFNQALQVAQEQQQYNRTQFANYQQRLQPYQNAGGQSLTRLSDILAQPGAGAYQS